MTASWRRLRTEEAQRTKKTEQVSYSSPNPEVTKEHSLMQVWLVAELLLTWAALCGVVWVSCSWDLFT